MIQSPDSNPALGARRRRVVIAGSSLLVVVAVVVLGAATRPAKGPIEARRGFKTRLVRKDREADPPPVPPARTGLSLVSYRGPLGDMAAYLSSPPGPGKHPAIVWLTGGFPVGGIGDFVWEEGPRENDQSAVAYRRAGVVTMYPSVRGACGNPGVQESFLGEVDDVVAAVEYLRSRDFVDPTRVYLGGHSSGGSLALLVAASTDHVRAVFSFGPTDDIGGYGADCCPFALDDQRELDLRAPIRFLGAIRAPTLVVEGDSESGNVDALRDLAQAGGGNKVLSFATVRGATHFTVLAPVNELIARRIALDRGGTFSLSEEAANAAFAAASADR